MKLSLILILCLFFIIKSIDNSKYSINSFINYLKRNEYWEPIQEIKWYYGVSPSIGFCELCFESPLCEEVVRVYMTEKPTSGAGAGFNNLSLCEFLRKKYMGVLLKDMSINKSYSIINRFKNIYKNEIDNNQKEY